MKPAIFHRSAKQELEATVAYYEAERKGLGLDLTGEIEHAVARIQSNPAAGMPYKTTEFRYRLVRRFPYVVYYLELDESIWIAAVAHGRRRPGYWAGRQPE